MRTIRFMQYRNRDNLLHIETEGGIVNIRIGLHDDNGNAVTSVEILPDPDAKLDGHINNRLIVAP